MVDFLKLVGSWGLTAACLLGIPAAIYIDPDTTAGFLIVLGACGLLGMVMAPGFRGLRAMLKKAHSPADNRPAKEGTEADRGSNISRYDQKTN